MLAGCSRGPPTAIVRGGTRLQPKRRRARPGAQALPMPRRTCTPLYRAPRTRVARLGALRLLSPTQSSAELPQPASTRCGERLGIRAPRLAFSAQHVTMRAP